MKYVSRRFFRLTWQLFLVCFSGVLLASPKGESLISVKSETHFGECEGYCQTVLLVTNKEVRYTVHSWTKGAPDKSISRPTTKEEWSQLSQNAPLRSFFFLPSVIGHPDNVDQGEETLGFTTDERSIDTSFDYGANIKGLESYLKIIRKIREQMGKKLGIIPDSDGTIMPANH
jgi:hypothetical protein